MPSSLTRPLTAADAYGPAVARIRVLRQRTWTTPEAVADDDAADRYWCWRCRRHHYRWSGRGRTHLPAVP